MEFDFNLKFKGAFLDIYVIVMSSVHLVFGPMYQHSQTADKNAAWA